MTKTDKFIAKSTTKFGKQFSYDHVTYVAGEIPVLLTCGTHGDFLIQPKNHLRSEYGCPKCAKEGMTNKMLLSWETVLERLQAVHGDRYDYSNVDYTGMFNPITIICKDHGEFKMIPTNHETGQGCRACHLGLPPGETIQPKAKRANERAGISKLSTPTNFGLLNMLRPTRK